MPRAVRVILVTLLICLIEPIPRMGYAESPVIPRGQSMTLDGHGDAVYDVEFSPDGTVLASGSYDNTVKLWRVVDGRLLGTLHGHTDQVFRIAFSPDGKSLASCSGDGTTIVWDLQSKTSREVLSGHRDPMLDVAFARDGRFLATAGSHIQLWRNGDEDWGTPHTESFFSIAISPNGKQLACGSRDLIQIHSTESPDPTHRAQPSGGMVYQLCYSPDGRWLASASSDGNLELRLATDLTLQGSIRADQSALFTVCFSSDGRFILTGGRERVIRKWNIPDLEPIGEWRGPEETILAVALAGDGRSMASGSYDGKILLWRGLMEGLSD